MRTIFKITIFLFACMASNLAHGYVYLSRITNNSSTSFELTCHALWNNPVYDPITSAEEGVNKKPIIEPGEVLHNFPQQLPSGDWTPADPEGDANSLPCQTRGKDDIPADVAPGWELPETCLESITTNKKGTVTKRRICITNNYEKEGCTQQFPATNYRIIAQETITVTEKKKKPSIETKPPVTVCAKAELGKVHLIIDDEKIELVEIEATLSKKVFGSP